MIYVTPRRPRGKHSLTNHRLQYLKSIGGRDRRGRDGSRAHARTRKLDCESCGKPIAHHAGRRPSYCSARCRMREFGKGRSRKAFLGADTGVPTKRQKIESNNNALQRAKVQSGSRILGPASVLAIEVFGRAWQSRISSGGVAIEVAQLRPRALVNGGRQ